MDVLLATATELSRPDDDEAPLRAALARAKIFAYTRSWDDPTVDWSAARACVIRSTWNYTKHHEAFAAWIDRCAAATHLWNPPAVVHWNSHKRYLLDMERQGVPVVPTKLVLRGGTADLPSLFQSWPSLVIKPAISAGSAGARKFTGGDATAAAAHLADLTARGDALMQPYLPSVTTYGERALVVVQGEIVHAVRKGARFAGDPEAITPAPAITPAERALANAALATIPGPHLYARVDLALDETGTPLLMELELIEPRLFLDTFPNSADKLASAIASVV